MEKSRELGADDFPIRLLEIPQPPKTLWARGAWPETDTRFLTVVGSRALTPYGREACEKLLAGLAGYPISIVSGLALGADACAHKAALAAGLHCIGVPGSGLGDGVISPRSNFEIAKHILQAGGLLLSEHPDDYIPKPWDFPSRNRIMVGLSHAVLLIEAAEKSGTLITARLTHEYNRELLCVPHRIGDAHGFGAHLFLRLGATLVSEASHILEALNLKPQTQSFQDIHLEGNERLIFNVLSKPLAKEAIVHASGLPFSEVLTTLVMLELKGILKEECGCWRRV